MGWGTLWAPREADGFSPGNLTDVWETRPGFPRRPEHPASTQPSKVRTAPRPSTGASYDLCENSKHRRVRVPPPTPQAKQIYKISIRKSNNILTTSTNLNNYRHLLRQSRCSRTKKNCEGLCPELAPGPFFGDPDPPSTFTQQRRGDEVPAFEDLPSPPQECHLFPWQPRNTGRTSTHSSWSPERDRGVQRSLLQPFQGARGCTARATPRSAAAAAARSCAALCTCCSPRGTRRRRPSLAPRWLQQPLHLADPLVPPRPPHPRTHPGESSSPTA